MEEDSEETSARSIYEEVEIKTTESKADVLKPDPNQEPALLRQTKPPTLSLQNCQGAAFTKEKGAE